MAKLKQQITYMRQQMYSQGMLRELNGFDTAIRMFAESAPKKKTFNERAAEVWKKHKGKILAGAAIAATAGLGAYGGKKAYDAYDSAMNKNVFGKVGADTANDIGRKAELARDILKSLPTSTARKVVNEAVKSKKPTVNEILKKMKNGEDIPESWADEYPEEMSEANSKFFEGESHS